MNSRKKVKEVNGGDFTLCCKVIYDNGVYRYIRTFFVPFQPCFYGSGNTEILHKAILDNKLFMKPKISLRFYLHNHPNAPYTLPSVIFLHEIIPLI